MESKIYTIGYVQSPNTPCIKITGQWLKKLGFNIGDKLAFTLENNKIILSKVSQYTPKQKIKKQLINTFDWLTFANMVLKELSIFMLVFRVSKY